MDGPLTQTLSVLRSEKLLDQLASIEHERWSHWQRYLHDQCVRGEDGSLTIPAELVRRWSSQLETPYIKLSEEEKASDRDQVQRYLPAIEGELERVLWSEEESQGAVD